MFSRMEIVNSAASTKAYQDGVLLYNGNHASVYMQKQQLPNQIGVNGIVNDGNISYFVKLTVRNEHFFGTYCSCGQAMRGLCSHAVAVALKWSEQDMINTNYNPVSTNQTPVKRVVTDPSIFNIINQYHQKEDDFYEEKGTNSEGLRFVPVLHLEGKLPTIHFEFGPGKTYIIKNVEEFYDAMEGKIPLSFGKQFTVVPDQDMIVKEDQPLLDFFCDKMIRYKQEHEMNPGMIQVPKDRYLPLYKDDVDDILSMYEEKEIEISSHGTQNKVSISRTNPRFTIIIDKKSEDELVLSMKEKLQVLTGSVIMSVLSDQTLYLCDEDYRSHCEIFLNEISANQKAGITKLTLRSGDMKAFTGVVLPVIEPYFNMDYRKLEVEDYRPFPLEAKFYLDTPYENGVVCQPTFTYGQTEFNPLKNEKISDIYRDYYKEKQIESVIMKYFKYTDEKYQLVIPDNDDAMMTLLDEGVPELMKLGDVFISDELKKIHLKPSPKVSIGVSIKGDLLDLTIDSDWLSKKDLADLLSSYRSKKKYFRLQNGDYLKIEDNELKAIRDIQDAFRMKEKDLLEDKYTVPSNRAFYLNQVMKDDSSVEWKLNKDYKALVNRLKDFETDEIEIPPINATLRDYQKTGYEWMKMLRDFGFGGILADDMGLGKTLQVLTLFSKERADDRTFLVCCPASLVYNWSHEVEKFLPDFKVSVVNGDPDEREQKIRDYKNQDLLISSYDLLRRDIDLYKDCHFAIEVIDEAQFIKNQNTQNAHAVKQIQADTKFALTGTPIENRLSELWSIFDYLMPGYLYSYPMFRADIEMPVVKDNEKAPLERLQRMISPFVLRRMKNDVLKDLPDKIEETVYSVMEGEQKHLYAAVASRLMDELSKQTDEEFKTGKIQILSEILKLRQICCDPSICFEDYEGDAVKLETCMQVTEEALEGDHRVLIFSQFTSMLSQIAKELNKREIPYLCLTGETPQKKRMELVDEFQKGNVPVFLISLRAGGTGLNLTAADVVIHYDPWWNIAVQNQATDRTYRIGQKNMVTVYKLVVKDTIEDQIMKLQESKKQLLDNVFDKDAMNLTSLSRDELITLLESDKY